MNTMKAIAYAYPTSPNAVKLGCGDAGGWYVQQCLIRKGERKPPFIPEAGRGRFFETSTNPELIALYESLDGYMCPRFQLARNGGHKAAVDAIRAAQVKRNREERANI